MLMASVLGFAPLDTPSYPDPSPGGGYTNLLPTYVTNGDGTRWQCTPTMNYCMPDSSGLPSYLEG